MMNRHHVYAIKGLVKSIGIVAAILAVAFLLFSVDPWISIPILFVAALAYLYYALYDISKIVHGDDND
jgi:hypothetical protein